MKISIVIPLYNEADNLVQLDQELKRNLPQISDEYEVIFVDDGSSDETKIILGRLVTSCTYYTAIILNRNYGQTAAMMAGFNQASGDVIIAMDGDLQTDPADIPLLLEKINSGYDVCSGWRKHRRDNSITRTLPSVIANYIISLVSGVKLHDYGCTLKAYKKHIIKNVRLYGEMHRFIPVYARMNGATICEVTVSHRPRKHGESKYGINRTFKVILDLLVVKFLEAYSSKPIYIFGGFGLLNIFMSFMAFVAMIYFKFWGEKSFIETPLPLLTIMLFSIGTISILLGLIAEIVNRTYHESQNKDIYQIDTMLKHPSNSRCVE